MIFIDSEVLLWLDDVVGLVIVSIFTSYFLIKHGDCNFFKFSWS